MCSQNASEDGREKRPEEREMGEGPVLQRVCSQNASEDGREKRPEEREMGEGPASLDRLALTLLSCTQVAQRRHRVSKHKSRSVHLSCRSVAGITGSFADLYPVNMHCCPTSEEASKPKPL